MAFLKIPASIQNKLFNATLPKLKHDWKALKRLIRIAIDNGDVEKAFFLLEGAGYIGYKYNFLESFTDDEIEKDIDLVSNCLHISPFKITADSERIVFYDYFALENRGFTQQYINLIIKRGLHLLYVVPYIVQGKEENDIRRTVSSYSKGEVFVLPQGTRQQQIKTGIEKIVQFGPSKVLIHTAPWDILPCCLACLLRGTLVKTFLINITDHTYWPGAKSFHYFIDFREYGHLVNKQFRNISTERLIIIPTPPYLATNKQFEGFPVDTNGKIVGFSGGAPYKIVDKDNTFLGLVMRLLNENKDFIFFFASPPTKVLMEFIKKNNLEERFILIGDRRDINEVFKRIDIYFNTYPYGGGLMLQYAVANKKPILALYKEGLTHTRLDTVLDRSINEDVLINDCEKYVEVSNRVIRDAAFRKKFADALTSDKSDWEVFEFKLSRLLKGEFNEENAMRSLFIDSEVMTRFHIENDNISAKEYLFLKNKYFRNLNFFHRIITISFPLFTFRFLRKLHLI